MILISAKQKTGFYRCGVFHPAQQVEHAEDAFTAEQLVVLQAEPMLSVVVIANEAAEPKKPK